MMIKIITWILDILRYSCSVIYFQTNNFTDLSLKTDKIVLVDLYVTEFLG